MATAKQIAAAKKNILKAQAKWKSMSRRQRALTQPEGRGRARPGTGGGGEYYRVEVRPRQQFTSFRTQDVGKRGGLERVAGHRASGSWATQAWLISKTMAHREGNALVADHQDVQELLDTLSTQPAHQKGDVFKAHDRRNIPEREKPTPAQKRAQQANIKKAQAAKRK
ncbi:MAG: hypothetical protein AAB971_03675 [Patescibacteria group bacterium]